MGWALKAYQREVLLERGITTMFWTFDPLESRNAHLNLNKLGAVADEYVQDMYGQTDSPLHRGIGTDRFIPRWDLSSEAVADRMAGDGRDPPVVSDEGAVRALGATEGVLLEHTTSSEVLEATGREGTSDSVGYASVVFA